MKSIMTIIKSMCKIFHQFNFDFKMTSETKYFSDNYVIYLKLVRDVIIYSPNYDLALKKFSV